MSRRLRDYTVAYQPENFENFPVFLNTVLGEKLSVFRISPAAWPKIKQTVKWAGIRRWILLENDSIHLHIFIININIKF